MAKRKQASVETDAACTWDVSKLISFRDVVYQAARLAAICEQGRCSGTLHLGPVRFYHCRPGMDLQGSTIHTRATLHSPDAAPPQATTGSGCDRILRLLSVPKCHISRHTAHAHAARFGGSCFLLNLRQLNNRQCAILHDKLAHSTMTLPPK